MSIIKTELRLAIMSLLDVAVQITFFVIYIGLSVHSNNHDAVPREFLNTLLYLSTATCYFGCSKDLRQALMESLKAPLINCLGSALRNLQNSQSQSQQQTTSNKGVSNVRVTSNF